MIVAASDFHGDASTAGYPRFDDVRDAAMESVEYAVKNKAEAYVFCGDFITNDPSLDLMIRCVGMAKEMVFELDCAHIPSYWMSGNHDVFEDGLGTSVIQILPERSYGIHVLRPEFCMEMQVGFLPFTSASHGYKPSEVIKRWHSEGHRPRAIFGHLNVEGITPGSEISDFPRGRDIFFPVEECKRYFPDAVLVNGHIHKRCVFNGVHIVGSLVNLTRGEVDNEPGFLVLDV